MVKANARKQKVVRGTPIYQFEVVHPIQGPTYVGRPGVDKAALSSWRSFVKKAWHGSPTRLVQVASLLPAAPSPEPSTTERVSPSTGDDTARGGGRGEGR